MNSRQIKFRVWDNNLTKFVTEATRDVTDRDKEDICLSLDGEMLGYDGMELKGFDEKRFIIQQFTGLKDKNRGEIYEGDIIKVVLNNLGKFKTEFHPVVFVDAGYWCCFNNLVLGKMKFENGLEVVGNILENPEMLK